MKTQTPKPASIAKTRWAAYAAAAVSTALAESNSADAAIHYSGVLDVPLPAGENICHTFALDKPSHYFQLCHSTYDGYRNSGYFFLRPFALSDVRGYTSMFGRHYVSELNIGQKISGGHFLNGQGPLGNHQCCSTLVSAWNHRGRGFVGFSFDGGKGIQYGWVRVRVDIRTAEDGNSRGRAFLVHDYAYADPGEPLRAGQISSYNDAVSENSLGGLALGATGLLIWRSSRSRNTR